MILRIPHPPSPNTLAILKHPLAAILVVLAAFKALRPRSEDVLHRARDIAQNTAIDILRLALVALFEVDHHAEFDVDGAIAVGVDGPGVVPEVGHCTGAVVRDAGWVAAADDREGGWWGCGGEGGGWEVGGEEADELFAVLVITYDE